MCSLPMRTPFTDENRTRIFGIHHWLGRLDLFEEKSGSNFEKQGEDAFQFARISWCDKLFLLTHHTFHVVGGTLATLESKGKSTKNAKAMAFFWRLRRRVSLVILFCRLHPSPIPPATTLPPTQYTLPSRPFWVCSACLMIFMIKSIFHSGFFNNIFKIYNIL